ncbi:hypothetical protein V6U89_30105, partial [Micromonospora sp. CPCC 206171]
MAVGVIRGLAVARGFGFAGLEPGDVLGGGASDFGDELVAVVDAEGGVGGFDGEGCSGVRDADVDALAGDDEGSAAADTSFNPHRFGCRGRWGSGGAGVANGGDLGGAQGVGQAAQQDAAGGDLHEAAVESEGDPLSGEVVADGVLPSGEADQAGGVDEP